MRRFRCRPRAPPPPPPPPHLPTAAPARASRLCPGAGTTRAMLPPTLHARGCASVAPQQNARAAAPSHRRRISRGASADARCERHRLGRTQLRFAPIIPSNRPVPSDLIVAWCALCAQPERELGALCAGLKARMRTALTAPALCRRSPSENDCLVLGAWGCGGGGVPPGLVARAFAEVRLSERAQTHIQKQTLTHSSNHPPTHAAHPPRCPHAHTRARAHALLGVARGPHVISRHCLCRRRGRALIPNAQSERQLRALRCCTPCRECVVTSRGIGLRAHWRASVVAYPQDGPATHGAPGRG